MAEFTRKALKEIFSAADIEVPKDVLGQLCDLHTESIEDSGETIKDLKNKLKAAENERDKALKEVPDGETVSKKKYDDLKTEYDTYKTGIEERDAKSAKEKAVRAYFESKNITGKNLDIAMRGSSNEISGIEMDGDKIKDTKALDELVSGTFSGLVVNTTVQGAQTANPPAGNGGGVTKEEFDKMSYRERVNLYNENKELYDKFTGKGD